MFVFIDEMHCQVQGECGWVKDVRRGFGVDVHCILHYLSVESWGWDVLVSVATTDALSALV